MSCPRSVGLTIARLEERLGCAEAASTAKLLKALLDKLARIAEVPVLSAD
jgi:hypothetical protein